MLSLKGCWIYLRDEKYGILELESTCKKHTINQKVGKEK